MVEINIFENKEEMGEAAAVKAAKILRNAIKIQGKAHFIAATGTSQFEFLNSLTHQKGIEWDKTDMFHLDEYIGLPAYHPASFRKYLKERIVDIINPNRVHFIKGDAKDPVKECKRINNLISKVKIDVAFIGIGENGHLAFNDPPADFKTKNPYIIVDLDEKCRNQQVFERWFKSIEDVPKKAISMSIQEILRAKEIICICPDKRKAEAVRNCLSDDIKVTPNYPASILKTHKNVFCYLDKFSASLL
ncbi:MAG: glucosamine-6-phosphate deaminase [Promethearchaeota archaeon]